MAYYAWQFGSKLDWAFIFQHFFDGALVQGAQMTFFLSVIAQIAGILLGLLAALMKLSNSPIPLVNIVLRTISNFYIWLFRGTPLLVQLIIFATGLYEVGIHLDLITAALLALSLNEGAYMAEIVRAGIQSVDPGPDGSGQVARHDLRAGHEANSLAPGAAGDPAPHGQRVQQHAQKLLAGLRHQRWGAIAARGRPQPPLLQNMETFTIVSCYYLAMTTVWTWVQGWIENRLGTRR